MGTDTKTCIDGLQYNPEKMNQTDLLIILDKIKKAIVEQRILKGSMNIYCENKTNYEDQFPQAINTVSKINIKIDLSISTNTQIDF